MQPLHCYDAAPYRVIDCFFDNLFFNRSVRSREGKPLPYKIRSMFDKRFTNDYESTSSDICPPGLPAV